MLLITQVNIFDALWRVIGLKKEQFLHLTFK